jgi:hypothetical protein
MSNLWDILKDKLMSRDSLYNEYSNLRTVLKGLSPKLELYQKIKAQMKELEKLIDGDEAKIRKY